MGDYHIGAYCIRCDWRFTEQEGVRATAKSAAERHTDEAKHPTCQVMHRRHYCETLGCPPPEPAPSGPPD